MTNKEFNDLFSKEFREKTNNKLDIINYIRTNNKLDIINYIRTNNKLDIINYISLLYFKLWNNWKCPVCKVIQGLPNKGFKEYYCEHIGNKIGRFLNPLSKKIAQEILVESNEFI